MIEKFNNEMIFLAYEEAANYAISKAQENDLILASGSLYMIGSMREVFNNLINHRK